MTKPDPFLSMNCERDGTPKGECPYRLGECIKEKCHKWQFTLLVRPSKIVGGEPQTQTVYMCQDDIMRLEGHTLAAQISGLQVLTAALGQSLARAGTGILLGKPQG